MANGKQNATRSHFDYGTVSFETVPPDAGANIVEGGKTIARTPTNLYVRSGPVEYQITYEDQVSRVSTNVAKFAVHKFSSKFEVKRDYTNSIGMVLVRAKDPLYVCKFEVTQDQFQRVMGRGLERKPQQPIVNIKWSDAEAFCQKLSQMDLGFDGARRAHVDGWRYGLPTQAEWSRFSEGDAVQLAESVFDSRLSEPKEIDPQRKSSNRTRLYDLFGNVAEWCIGANNQPMTIGGSFYNRRPRQIPADLMADTQNLASSIAEGSPNIGSVSCLAVVELAILKPGSA